MPSSLDALRDSITDFVHQGRFPALVVRASDVELIYLLKIVEGLDQQERAHVFGLFPQPVSGDAGAYVKAVLEALRAQLDLTNQLRIAEGQPSWPNLPAECSDPAVPPARRLRSGIVHAATLIPGGVEHRLVFCLLPQAIERPNAYAEVLAGLLPSGKPAAEPVWSRVRLLLRDDAAQPAIIAGLRRMKNPDVLINEPELSPAALLDEKARQVTDPTLAEPQRMQLLTELASMDYAYGRLDEAIAKYEILYDYYRRHQVPLMQAFVLQGLGDVLRKIGRLPLARERYGQGLTLALDTKGLPLIMGLCYSVGETSLLLQQFKDAEDHLGMAAKIAAGIHNRAMEADALDKLGDARMVLKRPGEAVVAWRDAAVACRLIAYKERLISVLEKMSRAFGSARMAADQRACENELAAIRAGGPIKPLVAPGNTNGGIATQPSPGSSDGGKV